MKMPKMAPIVIVSMRVANSFIFYMSIDKQILINFNLNMLSWATLETLLYDLERGREIDTIDELSIAHHPSYLWKDKYLRSVIFLCNRFKVRRLRFVFQRGVHRTQRLDNIAQSNVNNLPYLRHVEVGGVANIRDYIWHFINQANVNTIQWKMRSEFYSLSETDQITSLLAQFTKSVKLESKFNLLQLSIVPACDVGTPEKPFNIDHDNPPENSRDKWLIVRVLERNNKAWSKCQMAIITLLGIVKKKRIILTRDTINIIIAMLWKVRKTRHWHIEPEVKEVVPVSRSIYFQHLPPQ